MSGWQVTLKNGKQEIVDGNRLKELAASGLIDPDTLIRSMSRNKMVRAGGISGLSFGRLSESMSSDMLDSLPPPMQTQWISEPEPASVTQEPKWITDYSQKSVPKKKRPGLLDVRFDSFLTTSLVSLAWQFALWFCFFGWFLLWFAFNFYLRFWSDKTTLIIQIGLSGLFTFGLCLFAAFCVRVVLEAIVVLFKIEEHLRG